MADTPAQAAPAKSKKLIIILAAFVLLLVIAAAAVMVLLSQRASAGADDADEDGARAELSAPKPKGPPTFLPMDSLVVNLSDPGGDRFAQIGITLELADAKSAEEVKTYMPVIRSEVLKQVSRRSAEELLTPEGKDALAQDVRREAARPLGWPPAKQAKRKAQQGDEDDGGARASAGQNDNPVRAVHFSSFIIQ